MEKEQEYFAFISYKEEDYGMAKWLQKKLEHYHLPSFIRKNHPTLPSRIKPIFEYKSEMAGGYLKPEIKKALVKSKYLIVICSTNAPKSIWVADEVQKFIDAGKTDYIIPFVISGEAYSNNPEKECFPEPLRKLKEPLRGISINELGRDAAATKIVAQMFNLKFDTLWQRYEREKRKKRWIIGGVVVLFALLCLSYGVSIYYKNVALNTTLSRILAEKANQLADSHDSYLARLIALQALPPNRPWTAEAESALRKSCQQNDAILYGHTEEVNSVSFSPNGKYIVSAASDSTIRIWDAETGRQIGKPLKGHSAIVNSAFLVLMEKK